MRSAFLCSSSAALRRSSERSRCSSSARSSRRSDWSVRAALRRVFDGIDRNHDGSINKRELILTCRRSQAVREFLQLPQHIRQEDGTRDIFEELYQKMDKDGSKSVDRDEFVAFFLTRPPPNGTTPLALQYQ